MNIAYTMEQSPFAPDLVQAMAGVAASIFQRPVDDLQWRLSAMPCASVACARVQGELVGFKIGYAYSQSRYYSWLGGVSASYRRKGIAAALMALQHDWAREQGFAVVETATDQTNIQMTQANLKGGFVICGLKNKRGHMQVLFSKALCGDPDGSPVPKRLIDL